MIRRYNYGVPFETGAVVENLEQANGVPYFGEIEVKEGFTFRYHMDADMIVYGLGEANRGINKRGYRYVAHANDDPDHSEDKVSLYGVHNLVIFDGNEHFGLFVDYPSEVVFDIGYTNIDLCEIRVKKADFSLYVITGENSYDIVKQFRKLIGMSYIPPKFAFGMGQSRWGYRTREDFERVVSEYRNNHIPLDMLYMDIDYMDHYKDFTLNPEEFSDFPGFVGRMKEQNIQLVPIIDAGVKVEEGYDVYEEGVKNQYFCTDVNGVPFKAAVWPGYTHFPDVLNDEARAWFGNKYKVLLDAGIEGFWNDMNEPAIFHSEEGMRACKEALQKYIDSPDDGRPIWDAANACRELANSQKDYESMYHNINGVRVKHSDVHNLFGYYMTRSAKEAFDRLVPEKRILMFSRSSYIGMHRYGGIWQGDNKSWWSHILLNLKMMASLNMCGFIYNGADIGGFGCDTTEDLVLRWLALGVFTPLMRNHAALGTREQEPYQFTRIDDFRHVIGTRYRLVPYIYSEFMKAVLTGDMYARPIGFDYPEDAIARHTEDQLFIGQEIMIAPVYTQNAIGRYVYLPEEMIFVRFTKEGIVSSILPAGHHFVEVALNEVPLFIRYGKCIPVAKAAESVGEIDYEHLSVLGYEHAEYVLYNDDGSSKDYFKDSNYRLLS